MESNGSATVEEPRSAEEAEPSQTAAERSEEILRTLLASLQDGNRVEQRAAWAELHDPDIMATLADGWRMSET